MIDFTHVTKSYEDNWKALNNVTFRVNKGEFVFLTGHSGAGKSTVLKLIYMDERPDEDRGGQVMVKFTGECVYDSKNTPDKKIQALRRKMGIVFQDFKLLPDRNVFENVALALRIVGTPSNKINNAVFDALALVGISQKRFAMPYTLSGGEQQRVAIARAMVHNPYVLLADEPTGNLDPERLLAAEGGFQKELSKHRYYKVRSGDCLGKIARKYGISIQRLKQLNNIKGNLIRPGQVLRCS